MDKQHFVDHKDMIVFFNDACRRQNREEATSILLVMAEACPLRTDKCLVDKFCPECDFYKRNGVVIPLENES